MCDVSSGVCFAASARKNIANRLGDTNKKILDNNPRSGKIARVRSNQTGKRKRERENQKDKIGKMGGGGGDKGLRELKKYRTIQKSHNVTVKLSHFIDDL